MESYTPVVVCVSLVALAAWKFGWLAKLRSIPVGPPTVRVISGNPSPRATATTPPVATSIEAELDRLDSATLGLAFQRAVKRDAEAALSAEMAAKSHAEALSRWQAPFTPPGGQTGPLPTQASTAASFPPRT